MQYKTALVIGRFQPFHEGHMYLIREALEIADQVMIGIGSANILDLDNPFDYQTRVTMLKTAIAKAGIGDKVKKIVPIDDVPDDNKWLKLAIKQTGPEEVNVIVGNNEWVNGLYEAQGYPVVRIEMFNRHLYEGRKIREKMRQSGELLK